MSLPEEASTTFGLLRVAGTSVALRLSALREVVRCPDVLEALPVAAPGLLGAMQLRDLVVPVLDLAVPFGREAVEAGGTGSTAASAAGRDRMVVVVTDGELVVGIVADDVQTVVDVPPGDLLTVHAKTPLLLSHAFRSPIDQTIVSVLDAAAVLRLPGVPTVRISSSSPADGSGLDRAAAGSAVEAPAGSPTGMPAARAGRRATLLRCGSYVVALDVDHVHTTLPGRAPSPSVLDGELCRGVVPYGDREVPVADLLVLLGLGRLTEQEGHGAGVVLDLSNGYVVIPVSELVDIVELRDEQVMDVPAFAVPRPDLLRGVVDVDGVGQCLVLDGVALRAEPRLTALGGLNTAADGSSGLDGTATDRSSRSAAVPRGPAHLTFTAGTELATPLDQVSEILPLPASLLTTAGGRDGDPALLGLLTHRSAAVPVLHLGTLLGLPVDGASAIGATTVGRGCVLLVDVDGLRAAFAVDGLHDIEPLAWEDPVAAAPSPRTANDAAGPVGAALLRSSPLVQVGDDDRLLRALDLRRLTRALRAAPAAADPADTTDPTDLTGQATPDATKPDAATPLPLPV